MDTPPGTWHARIDGKTHGPVDLPTLQHWAATGGITAWTEVGGSPEGPWTPAADLDALEMHWQVMDEEGEKFHPCHVLALRGEVEAGNIQPFWDVVHLPTGETYQVVDALCSALMEQNKILEQRLARSAVPPPPSSGEDMPGDWSTLMRELDHQKRDSKKWKRLYEDELERNQIRERELQNQIEELRGWQRKASERIKALERRRTQLEELNTLPEAGEVQGGDRDLREAYQELRVQMDHLVQSLELRNQQLESTRETLRGLEDTLRTERVQRADERDIDRSQRAETEAQLTRLEQAHIDLTRSYRDLNERMIRLRNEMELPTRIPLNRDAHPPAEEASPEKTPSPPDTTSRTGRVKIKLT